jgi:hypothetical protein
MARHGAARRGEAGHGQTSRGLVGHGAARSGLTGQRQGRHGMPWLGGVWRDATRLGKARQARRDPALARLDATGRGMAGPGEAGLGEARQARLDRAGRGGRGKARLGGAGPDTARQAWRGLARRGRPGKTRLGGARPGAARRGRARRGKARQACPGGKRRGLTGPGSVRSALARPDKAGVVEIAGAETCPRFLQIEKGPLRGWGSDPSDGPRDGGGSWGSSPLLVRLEFRKVQKFRVTRETLKDGFQCSI